MSALVACPFCRAMFERGEAASCPECGLALERLSRLPASRGEGGEGGEGDEALPPHMEQLPWTYLGRGRGVLLGLSLVGMVAFFLPWVRETAPDLQELSGFGFALKLGWMWAPAVAWFVMVPLVASRRSIWKMRGARVAVAFLAGVVVTCVAARLAFTPAPSPVRPVRFEWGYGLYVTGLLGVAALAAAARFGGSAVELPTKQARRGDETLH
ncbi:MAG: hypothetical protein WKG00_08260 [Polyangiaceae bacterium]